MSPITTHVLDTSLGEAVAGIPVSLAIQSVNGQWTELSRGVTDSDGRLNRLLKPDSLAEGTYRLTFNTQAYFETRKSAVFYPQVTVVFCVRNPKQQYHIPLLLSPFGYSTYRGS